MNAEFGTWASLLKGAPQIQMQLWKGDDRKEKMNKISEQSFCWCSNNLPKLKAGGWSPQFEDTAIAAKGQWRSCLAVANSINSTLMPSQGKKGLVDGPISTSFRNGPDEQSIIRWWIDDQLVVIASKAAVGTQTFRRITRGCQLHLVRDFIGCWLLMVRSDIVDNGQIFYWLAQQTISFAIKSGAWDGLSAVEWLNKSKK